MNRLKVAIDELEAHFRLNGFAPEPFFNCVCNDTGWVELPVGATCTTDGGEKLEITAERRAVRKCEKCGGPPSRRKTHT